MEGNWSRRDFSRLAVAGGAGSILFESLACSRLNVETQASGLAVESAANKSPEYVKQAVGRAASLIREYNKGLIERNKRQKPEDVLSDGDLKKSLWPEPSLDSVGYIQNMDKWVELQATKSQEIFVQKFARVVTGNFNLDLNEVSPRLRKAALTAINFAEAGQRDLFDDWVIDLIVENQSCSQVLAKAFYSEDNTANSLFSISDILKKPAALKGSPAFSRVGKDDPFSIHINGSHKIIQDAVKVPPLKSGDLSLIVALLTYYMVHESGHNSLQGITHSEIYSISGQMVYPKLIQIATVSGDRVLLKNLQGFYASNQQLVRSFALQEKASTRSGTNAQIATKE